jgi:hypothetical protein
MVNQRNQLIVWTTLEVPIAFTQIYVYLYGVFSWHRKSLFGEDVSIDEKEAV